MEGSITIAVYLDCGVVRKYQVKTPEAAREHAFEIIKTGYRYCTPGELVHVPPHKILKVKCTVDAAVLAEGNPENLFSTGYTDTTTGT